MRWIRLAGLVAAALLSVGAGKPRSAPAAPHPNWLTTISVSPSGSHLMGNPAAPVKLVEYISYTCPHCAHFQQQSEVAMRLAYIQTGKVQDFPVALMGTDYWRPLLDMLRVMVAEKTIDPLDLDRVIVSDDPGEVVSGITDTAMKRFGLTYGPRAKPRWWLLENFGRLWQRLRR